MIPCSTAYCIPIFKFKIIFNRFYSPRRVSFKLQALISQMSQQEFISNQPVVIDNGTGVMKAGLAGVERPSCEFRSCVGQPKYSRVINNGFAPNDNLYERFACFHVCRWVGKDLESHRGLCYLEYPMKHGIVENWDLMESIWKHIYSKSQLGLDSREHPVWTGFCPDT